MWSIASKLFLGLIVILLLPTGMVLASQDAVPGDSTYGIKRGLENVIAKAASVHPATRTYFKTDFSKRRFKEAVTLIDRGDNASNSLKELVSQTKSAADSMNDVSDKNLRKQFASDLSKQIDEYDKKLAKIEENKKNPTPAPKPSVTTNLRNTLTPTPTPVSQVSTETEQTIEELRRIREELEQVKNQLNNQQNTSNSTFVTPTITPTPVPTSIPTVAPTAVPTRIPTAIPTRVPVRSSSRNPASTSSMTVTSLGDTDLTTASASPSGVVEGVSTAVPLIRLWDRFIDLFKFGN